MTTAEKIRAIEEIMAAFEARPRLPQMSQVANAALALHCCLNVIDAVKAVLAVQPTLEGT
jgi:hypothetical protein